jgi:hypothetical protein
MSTRLSISGAVEHLDRLAAVGRRVDEEVRRLEVAVHDPDDVRVRHGLERLQHEVGRVGDGEGTPRDALLEVFSLEQLHHDVGLPFGEGPDVHDAGHMLALQPGDRARLAQEAGDDRRLVTELSG